MPTITEIILILLWLERIYAYKKLKRLGDEDWEALTAKWRRTCDKLEEAEETIKVIEYSAAKNGCIEEGCRYYRKPKPSSLDID